MRRAYTKLILVLVALIVSGVMIVSVSYAWLVLSKSPVAEGIQITIGGGTTILVAPDQTHEVNGTTYHYPGSFKGTLNFSQSAGYDYLGELSSLTPVSTVDGVNWFIPTYYDVMDPEVQEGLVLSGTLKPWAEFELDNALLYANLGQNEARAAAQGSYIYLDFWVVSPGEDYTLRISTGEDSGGSYVIGLPKTIENGEGGYSFSAEENYAAACIRVGLLANTDYVTDDTMWYYQSSPVYSSLYTCLRGVYQEAGGSVMDSSNSHFTIYEPNADFHPTINAYQGDYLITRPIGLSNGIVGPVDVKTSLTVQTQSTWTDAPVGEGSQLEQRFQTAILEPSFRGLSLEKMTQKFYDEYLAAQVAPYVTKGLFVKNTETLYNAAGRNGIADEAFLRGEYAATATDDACIVQLEKNVPQRIRMFVWLEGQDADCVNEAEASALALRIELAGSSESFQPLSSTEMISTQSETLLVECSAGECGIKVKKRSKA